MYARTGNWSRRNLIGILTFQNMTHIWPKNLAAFGQITFLWWSGYETIDT